MMTFPETFIQTDETAWLLNMVINNIATGTCTARCWIPILSQTLTKELINFTNLIQQCWPRFSMPHNFTKIPSIKTHLPLVPHICQWSRSVLVSDNGLSPIRRPAIIWTSPGLLSIGPLGTNYSEILIKIQNFSFTKNAFENIVCETVAILFRGVWVKGGLRISWWG